MRGGSISLLRELLNLRTNEDFVLVVCWVLAAIALDGPFPILVVNGEQGSAKSTFSSIIRSLVDPNTASVRTLPRNEQDLFVASQHSRILAFDNLSGITPSMSDALCRVATGGAFASRKLYSDGEEVLLNACNPILLNGISGTVTRADLADRSLFIRLEPIPDAQRRPVAEVMSDFEEAYPAIFGALLDAASEGLRRIDTIPTSHLPRMADFAKLARACETALWPEGTFQKAYASNVDAAVNDMIDADEVAAALRDMMNRLENWKGTSSELLASLKREIGEMGARSSDWPKSARGLSERLKRAETVLRKIGIRIKRRKEGRSRNRILVISNAAFRGADPETFEQPSAPSSSSAQIKKVSGPSEIRTEGLQTQPIMADATSKRSSKTARSKALKRNEMDDADDTDGMEQCPCKQ